MWPWEFLSGVQAIVWYPYRNIWLCALLLALLAGSMFVRDRLFPDNSKVILFSLVADFAICFAIIILLNFNYNGILLLVFSNVILYAKNGKSRYFLAAVAIGSFILADYELLSISYRLYFIQDYISFYNATTQQYLLSSYKYPGISECNHVRGILCEHHQPAAGKIWTRYMP